MLKEWCLKMWLISKNQWRPVSAPKQIDDHDMKLSDFSRIKQPSQVLGSISQFQCTSGYINQGHKDVWTLILAPPLMANSTDN